MAYTIEPALSGRIVFWTRRVSKGKELKRKLKEECDGVLEREIGWWRRESVAWRGEVD